MPPGSGRSCRCQAQLRAREIATSLADDSYISPRNATEERLAHIVAPLLRLDRVSVDGDFFKLGGHSLLGTQLIARLRDAFGVRIRLRLLFESPTIAALALEVDRLLLERVGSAEPDVRFAAGLHTPILKRSP